MQFHKYPNTDLRELNLDALWEELKKVGNYTLKRKDGTARIIQLVKEGEVISEVDTGGFADYATLANKARLDNQEDVYIDQKYGNKLVMDSGFGLLLKNPHNETISQVSLSGADVQEGFIFGLKCPTVSWIDPLKDLSVDYYESAESSGNHWITDFEVSDEDLNAIAYGKHATIVFKSYGSSSYYSAPLSFSGYDNGTDWRFTFELTDWDSGITSTFRLWFTYDPAESCHAHIVKISERKSYKSHDDINIGSLVASAVTWGDGKIIDIFIPDNIDRIVASSLEPGNIEPSDGYMYIYYGEAVSEQISLEDLASYSTVTHKNGGLFWHIVSPTKLAPVDTGAVTVWFSNDTKFSR